MIAMALAKLRINWKIISNTCILNLLLMVASRRRRCRQYNLLTINLLHENKNSIILLNNKEINKIETVARREIAIDDLIQTHTVLGVLFYIDFIDRDRYM